MVNPEERDRCCEPGKPGEGLRRERSRRRGTCCLAGCSRRCQAAFQLRLQQRRQRLEMEFRPSESLQGSPVCSGNSDEQSKGCCRSRRGLNKRRAQEKSPAVSAARGIGAVPGVGCACAARGGGRVGTTWGARWEEETTALLAAAEGTLPGRAASGDCRKLLCVQSDAENWFSLLECKGKCIMQKKRQGYVCRLRAGTCGVGGSALQS